MGHVWVAALAGAGAALALASLMRDLQEWWEPSWRTTRRFFQAAQDRAPLAAGAGFGAHLTLASGMVAHVAAAALAWGLACVVLPALRSRTYPDG